MTYSLAKTETWGLVKKPPATYFFAIVGLGLFRGLSGHLHRPDEVQGNVSLRIHPHFLIGLRRAENAHLEQIAGSDDGYGRVLLRRRQSLPTLAGAEAAAGPVWLGATGCSALPDAALFCDQAPVGRGRNKESQQ